MRPDAKLDGSKPISGGIPFCFPQFGPGEIQQHGFARNVDWTIASTSDGAEPSVVYTLAPSECAAPCCALLRDSARFCALRAHSRAISL